MTNPGTLDAAHAPSPAARSSTDAGPSFRPSLADLEDRIDLHGPLARDLLVRWLCGWRVQLLAPVNGQPTGTLGYIVPVEHPAWQRCNRRRLLPVATESELVMVPFAELALAGAGPRGEGEPLESWLERCLRAGDLEVILAQRPDGLGPPGQAQLVLYRAAALRLAGRPDETLAVLDDARGLLRDPVDRADAARLRWRALHNQERYEEALRIGSDVEPLLASVPWRTRARCLAALAFAHHAAGSAKDADRLLTAAETCAAGQHDPLTSGELAMVRGATLRPTDIKAAATHQRQALRSFLAVGAIPECGYALGNLMLVAIDRLDMAPRTRVAVGQLLGLGSAAAACYRVTRNRPALMKVLSLLVEWERDPERALGYLDDLSALDPGATASDALHHVLRGQWEMAAQRWDQAEDSLARAARLVPEDQYPEGAARIAASRSLLATGRNDAASARAHLAHAEFFAGDAPGRWTRDAFARARWAVRLLDNVPGHELRDLELVKTTPGGPLSMWGSEAVQDLMAWERRCILTWGADLLQKGARIPSDLRLEPLVAEFFRFGQDLCHYHLRRGRPSSSVAVPLEPAFLQGWLEHVDRRGTREQRMITSALTAALSASERAVAFRIHAAVLEYVAGGPDRDHLTQPLSDILRRAITRGLTLEAMVDAAAREVEEQLDNLVVAHRLGDAPPVASDEDPRPSQRKRHWRDGLRRLTRLLEPTACPWPLDLRCRCGADLRPFLFCCDSSTPVNYAFHAPRLCPGYQIPCRRCGDELSGFLCIACGQAVTWDLGVVPTLKGEN
ncbi:MAG: hypothetical protein IT371_31115 [Deltaproteobacteria bacterium]|nr:hypothetical protein [Deltaproteobacteria bacterium]